MTPHLRLHLTLDPVQSPTHLDHQMLCGTKEEETSVWINGIEVIALNTETAWSYDFSLAEGENLLSIVARDRAGNESAPASATIVYDDISPMPVPVTADGDGIGTTVSLDWTGYDEQGQEDVLQYHIYGQTYLFTQVGSLSPVATVPAGPLVIPLPVLPRGRHIILPSWPRIPTATQTHR